MTPYIVIRKAATTAGRILAFIMLALFSVFFLFEAAQELGMLNISPDAEHWK